jgi:hypothetical protein
MIEPEPPILAEDLWEMKKELDRKRSVNCGEEHESSKILSL